MYALPRLLLCPTFPQAIDLNTIDVELQLTSIYREMSPKMRNALMVVADMGLKGEREGSAEGQR
jgi:hypothetical protein